MRDFLQFAVNGKMYRIHGGEAFTTLAEWLRRRHGLTATKIVCAEGDCGACSVLVGRPHGDRIEYLPIDSCIQFLHQLDATHVVTPEGLGSSTNPHPVQTAMVEHFGSQCGYCTPGFVSTIAGLFETGNGRRPCAPEPDEVREKLSGNLCRCTGYVQIVEAACSIDPASCPRVSDLYPDSGLLPELARLAAEPVRIDDGQRSIVMPVSVEEACRMKSGATTISGATDVGVLANKGRVDPVVYMSLAKLQELRRVAIEEGHFVAGARATWTEIEAAVRDVFPEYSKVLRRFGSPQIRNAGTIGGNLANASPIADAIPFLFVTDSRLHLHSPAGERRVPIIDFYLGYKKIDLKPEELIAAVETPLPRAEDRLRLYKISRRRDMDISTFTAAVLTRVEDGTITHARVAMGGVGPTVLRLYKTEEYLLGQPFGLSVFEEAGRLAAEEITPISDVRGSRDYRLRLAKNIMARYWHDATAREEVHA